MIFYLNYVSLNIFWLKTMDTKLANASTRNAIISARVQLIFFFFVTQRSSERCMTTQRTAAWTANFLLNFAPKI